MAKINKPGVLLPPAVGYSLHILLALIWKNKISPRYYLRVLILVLINLINWPFRSYERLFINPRIKKTKLEEAPIFIIGHWRSGTTHLHNLMCQDPQMAYTTTYQVVFPDTFLNHLGSFIFKSFTRLLIPGRRKGDSVVLDTEYPQEEEFATGDKTPLCFYYWWMFPSKIMEYYEEKIRFKQIKPKLLESWKEDYLLLMKKAIYQSKKKIFISKNPPNTGRLTELLQMFPKARFIHIHRNPVEVILSTWNFYDKMLPPLQLQSIDREKLNTQVLEIYTKIMGDFMKQKKQIPKEQLLEVAFDDLEKTPMALLKKIYDDFEFDHFEKAAPHFKTYIEKNKHYKKNTHYIKKSLLNDLQNKCGFVMEEYRYSIPIHLEVNDV